MPLTDEAKSRRYLLLPGEKWWICGKCQRILGRLKLDGSLERRREADLEVVEPHFIARVTVTCQCHHVNWLVLSRGDRTIDIQYDAQVQLQA